MAQFRASLSVNTVAVSFGTQDVCQVPKHETWLHKFGLSYGLFVLSRPPASQVYCRRPGGGSILSSSLKIACTFRPPTRRDHFPQLYTRVAAQSAMRQAGVSQVSAQSSRKTVILWFTPVRVADRNDTSDV